ncbi:hypothetical protein BU24DRAFT_210700 [Aaosphaeria arxii CBS 175.79]|uniref:Zn(2)-C6 fungal-type domain-containing protein n=1 Tax=Aaosphaeria arxii CBS 175.79 TaxID=1450172 RepID=A0A6A5XLI2_9PLEO|nr:uncharacterized protein BU24DRAFT_210700 [Aaosphaeria arxii CBS 175.79]KAF2014125.1 hypothetical protein BU24DRAFT_210700 [Aaosphaeria arxii CBS 175.79]
MLTTSPTQTIFLHMHPHALESLAPKDTRWNMLELTASATSADRRQSYLFSATTIAGQGACTACRGRLTKCSLTKPQCSECNKRGTGCTYTAASKSSSPVAPSVFAPPAPRLATEKGTKRKFDQILNQHPAPCPFQNLYQLMQSSSPEVAMDIFRRIRQGDDAASVLRHFDEGHLLVQFYLQVDSKTQTLSTTAPGRAGKYIQSPPALSTSTTETTNSSSTSITTPSSVATTTPIGKPATQHQLPPSLRAICNDVAMS